MSAPSQHPVSLRDLSVWCYACEAFVISEDVAILKDLIYFFKFGEEALF